MTGRESLVFQFPGLSGVPIRARKNKLDKLMISFRVTNPDFYTNYLNARIIVDLGAGKKAEAKAGMPPEG